MRIVYARTGGKPKITEAHPFQTFKMVLREPENQTDILIHNISTRSVL